ncbi:C-_U-editing enzyme APOBEC-1-like [Talpa occidentalis]|uniref:C->U-editing enzyme APOBEC-1-like n=1 Tax=Talpa occidentalis TaxID=50954 RepID=UPI00188DD03F|nr:C->U-editing enzyme APOBEC-1-like [Talpa occidentalis]
MTSDTGPTEEAAFRRRIEPQEFAAFFDPKQLRKETCLLYEILWNRSQKIWRHSVENTNKHAEVNFKEKFTADFHPAVHCTIIWFLSWSPCSECSRVIREFLSQHPNVTLIIYVARLYHHLNESNRQGLRDLRNSGVRIQVMKVPDYHYCWRNFVNYSPGEEGNCPRFPHELMNLYSLELHCIFLSLPSCFKISRRHKTLNWFTLTLQNCHYEMFPPHILSVVAYDFRSPLYSNFL